ncbi:NADP-dependent oxidoreductase [Actinopolymorpha alba]|uniref:NADP-dependent oxidoreductase n=1 Tax=Actinopolymorpha alba TaxID=533267 RepID=UPI000370BABB|nr:NADP-dependent oxidoreductase [Actinopolymorpha alba]
MSRRVIFDRFGGVDALTVETGRAPTVGSGQVRVRVLVAGLNPVDAKILAGGPIADRFGVRVPAGMGNDFAGVIDQVGAGVEGVAVGDLVYGGARLRAQADHLIIDDLSTLNPVPPGLGVEVAGALDIAGRTALAGVAALRLTSVDTVYVSGAAGGVGILAVQLTRATGARVLGSASVRNHDYLRALGVEPVEYGPQLADRLRTLAPGGLSAVFATRGADDIEQALALGVPPQRVNAIIDADLAASYGVLSVGRRATEPAAVRVVAEDIAAGRLVLPIDATYELDEVRAAYRHLLQGHVRGKVVLRTTGPVPTS